MLAGGAASRFGGRPKGLAVVGEIRIADRVLAALRGATDELLVVSNAPEAPEWFPGVAVISDEVPGMGPLAGIATALRGAAGASVVVVGWDMPYVTTPLLRGMRALGEAGAAAVVPVHGESDTREPLCAFYSADAAAVCTALLSAGERRAGALFEALPSAVTIPERLLEAHGDPERLFLSVDTPEQLEEIGGTLP